MKSNTRVGRFTTSIFKFWSWWWESGNQKDELARALLTLSLALLFITWFTWVTKRLHKRSPPLPPGPRGLPLLGSLPFIDTNIHQSFTRFSRTYGPIIKVRLGYKLCIVVASPALAKEVLKDHDIIFANRDLTATSLVVSHGGLDIAWTPYDPHWRMVRKVCVKELLTKTSLDASYALRRRETRRMVRNLYSKIGTPINVAEKTFVTILNVMMSMLRGSTLSHEERSSVGGEFQEVTGKIMEILGMVDISDLFPVLGRFDIGGMKRQVEKLVGWLDQIFDAVIDQRVKMDRAGGGTGQDEGKDFLQLLLKLVEEPDPQRPMTTTAVKAMLQDMVLAGTDTTSTTVDWAMAEMMQHPKIVRKTQEEIEKVVGMDNIVEETHVSKLPYLKGVMKEVLRLHPVVPLLIPRCPSQSCTVGGYTIPKEARVLVNVWAIHRDPAFWDNPLEFQPERFLKDTCHWDFMGNDFRYLPFGSGRRMCAGTLMAERTVLYLLATLLHSFEWKFPEGIKVDLSEKNGIVLKKAMPVIAIPTPRLSNPELYD